MPCEDLDGGGTSPVMLCKAVWAQLGDGMQVKDFARVADSIIGWGSSVGRWARIDNKSVIGEDVHVKVRHRALTVP